MNDKQIEAKIRDKIAEDWGPLPWKAWGSWFSWGSPVGLGLLLVCIGITVYFLHLAGLVGR